MANILVSKLREGVGFRVNTRIPITSGETIPDNDTGSMVLRLVNGALTMAVTGAAVVGISDMAEARTGVADLSILGKYRPGDSCDFRFPQGALADADVEIGDLLDINAAATGFEVGSQNGDAIVVANSQDEFGNDIVHVRLQNVQPIAEG